MLPATVAHTHFSWTLATIHMRRITVILIGLTLLGCTNQPNERTKEQLETIEQLISSIKVEIEEFVNETGARSKPIDQVNFIDSLSSAYLNIIDKGSDEDVKKAFLDWTNTVSTVYSTDYHLNYLNNGNSLEHKLELSIKSLKLISDIKSNLDYGDLVFDQIEVVFIPQISELTLGETYETEIFMGALMRNTSEMVDYFYNGNKLEKSEKGGGKLLFKPNKLGIHLLSVTAQVEGPNGQPFEFNNEIKILVK